MPLSLSMEAGRKLTRRYGVSCLVCRKKKIRCCGEKPACKNCAKSGIACRYKASDSVPSTVYGDLEKAQARVLELEESLRELSVLNPDDRDSFLSQITRGLNVQSDTSPESNTQALGSAHSQYSLDHHSSVRQGGLEQADLSVDEHGELEYFGATSRFHQEPEDNNKHGTNNANSPNGIDERYHKKWLLSNARFRVSWERQAHAKLNHDTDIDAETAIELLQIYWTWQGPLHNCVYRPCFYRDMALDGPYFSAFLLNVLYAHACRHTRADDPRFTRYAQGDYFLHKAKHLLLEEFDQSKPRIPTIQGLLILGGRQCAVGKHSEGWLYTGMAIRMLKDLGLHLHNVNNPLLSKLEPDDLEATKRLCLSAYVWDKSISLCLGRRPSLNEMPFHPSTMLDPVGDDDIWRPLYLVSVEETYPVMRSYTTLTFSWFCRLSMLIHEIYNTVYSRKPNDLSIQAVLELEERLHHFYRDLPDALRVGDISSAAVCPPPHIFCLNILYHTLLILLFRPFFLWSSNPKLRNHELAIRSKTVCIKEATLVNDFFRSYGETFKYQKQSYLISYCVYTAATIEIQQVRDPDESIATEATERLCTILNMLETEAKQTPGIRRSVDIIKSQLESKARDQGQRSRKFRERIASISSPEQKDNSTSSEPHYAQRRPYPIVSEAHPNEHLPGMQSPTSYQGHIPSHHLSQGPEIESRLGFGTSDGIVDTVMTESGQWSEWPGFGLGGGFVPDMENMTFYDNFWGADESLV